MFGFAQAHVGTFELQRFLEHFFVLSILLPEFSAERSCSRTLGSFLGDD